MGKRYNWQVREKETQINVCEAVWPHQNQGNVNKNHSEIQLNIYWVDKTY